MHWKEASPTPLRIRPVSSKEKLENIAEEPDNTAERHQINKPIETGRNDVRFEIDPKKIEKMPYDAMKHDVKSPMYTLSLFGANVSRINNSKWLGAPGMMPRSI